MRCCSSAVGALGALSHYLIIRAFDYAPPVVLAPFAYLQIVAALLLGWLVFGNFPGPMALLGMALIVFTGVTMGLRQRVPRRAAVAPRGLAAPADDRRSRPITAHGCCRHQPAT